MYRGQQVICFFPSFHLGVCVFPGKQSDPTLRSCLQLDDELPLTMWMHLARTGNSNRNSNHNNNNNHNHNHNRVKAFAGGGPPPPLRLGTVVTSSTFRGLLFTQAGPLPGGLRPMPSDKS